MRTIRIAKTAKATRVKVLAAPSKTFENVRKPKKHTARQLRRSGLFVI
jgi:hypothetical protein